MKIASWNINGVRALRRQGALLRWLHEQKPDVVALQKIQVPEEDFPTHLFARLGYDVTAHCGNKDYGVAVLSRKKHQILCKGLPGQEQLGARLLTVEVDGLEFSSVYAPFGSNKGIQPKLKWFESLTEHFRATRSTSNHRVLCGDFNVVAEYRVGSSESPKNSPNYRDDVRERFEAFLKAGGLFDLYTCRAPKWKDPFMFEGPQGRLKFSRLEYVLGTQTVVDRHPDVEIDFDYGIVKNGVFPWIRAPIIADLRDPTQMKRGIVKSSGNVLGIDVGWSTRRKSSAVCLLHWNSRHVDWEMRRFLAVDTEREDAVLRTAADRQLAAVAIDGPLRPGFDEIGRYRSAERILTHRDVRQRIGKPGQSSSPNGCKLNQQANESAKLVDEQCRLTETFSPVRIASRAIAEAFPTSFLGVMIDRPESLSVPRSGSRSDRYFTYLAETGHLESFLADLLPDRTLKRSLGSIRNHDDRAAFVCALTALCFASEDFAAVGDDVDGWIILPPRRHFSKWAWDAVSLAARADNEGGQLYRSGGPIPSRISRVSTN